MSKRIPSHKLPLGNNYQANPRGEEAVAHKRIRRRQATPLHQGHRQRGEGSCEAANAERSLLP